MRRDVTMLELVNAVTEYTRTEGEAIVTIVHMINSGEVRLCGTFSGASMASTGEPIQTVAGGVVIGRSS